MRFASVLETILDSIDSSSWYVRITSNPSLDLSRGYSYTAGSFGDEKEAHAGLSGYSVGERGLRGALDDLDDYLGLAGRSADGSRRYLVVFSGRDAGVGPDGEDLFTPKSIIAKIDCSTLTSVNDAVAKLSRMGIQDDLDFPLESALVEALVEVQGNFEDAWGSTAAWINSRTGEVVLVRNHTAQVLSEPARFGAPLSSGIRAQVEAAFAAGWMRWYRESKDTANIEASYSRSTKDALLEIASAGRRFGKRDSFKFYIDWHPTRREVTTLGQILSPSPGGVFERKQTKWQQQTQHP